MRRADPTDLAPACLRCILTGMETLFAPMWDGDPGAMPDEEPLSTEWTKTRRVVVIGGDPEEEEINDGK